MNVTTLPQRTDDPKLAMQPGDHLILRGPRMDYVIRDVRKTAGGTVEREVVIHPGAVIILPVLADGRIVLIRNRRHTVQDVLLELPAGTLEKGEDPAVCAARELTEETGYTAEKITPFGWFFTSPGVLTEKMYSFVATGLTAGSQDLDENEQIEPQVFTREELLALIQKNQIVDAKTIATLLKYFVASKQSSGV